jgi:hypothetical protein
MQKTYNVYNNLGYYFLLLLAVFVPLGFYKSYFSILLQPKPSIIHIHFGFMATWIVMLIVQPFLIKYNKKRLHRLIGKISYVIIPCLLIVTWFMLRYSYYHFLENLRTTNPSLTNDQMLQQAAGYDTITFIYITWLALFYFLGIINRKNSVIHSRYMLAAGLTMIGPAVDRMWYYAFGLESFFGKIPLETFAFLLVDVILVFLLARDYRNKKPLRPLSTALIIYIIGEILELTIQNSPVWKNIVAFLMQPVPA